MPQVEDEGYDATLKNTIKAPFTKFDIEGHSEQETTEGYNLLKLNDKGKTTPSGLTEYSVTNEEITLKGTTTSNGNFAIPFNNFTLSAGNYTLVAYLSNTVPSNSSQVILMKNGNDRIVTLDLWGGLKVVKNFTLSEDTQVASGTNYSYVYVNNNQTFDTKIKLMVLSGTYTVDNVPDWEKYTNGASPNPSYEQPIKSAGDNGSITEKIVNKNLVEKNLKGYVDIPGYMIIDNNSESFVFWAEQGKTYNYSCLKSTDRSRCAKSETINIVNGTPLTNVREVSNSFTSNFTGWCVLYVNTSLDNEIKDSFMIEQGSTATDYVPHEGQTYSIYTQQPFRSIGDVRDKFVKVNGNWFERHLPYIASYNGETLPQDVYNEEGGIKYCNSKSMSTTGQFSIGASVQYIDENNWNDLPCTPEQIQQLENLPSTYKDFTTINSEDETEAYLEVSGIYDLNNLINN